MVRRLAQWLDERLGLAIFARHGLNHIFPDHWSFMIGEVALYSFIILVITGAFLAMFFNSSTATVVYHGAYKALDGVTMSAAYHSVLDLSLNVPAGLFVRQTHHWAALVFIGAIVLHLFRIFFTGAYRRPREINWIIGVTLLIIAMGAGFVGYSVPDDLLSGTGLRIAYSITLSIPIIGEWLTFVIFGGEVPSNVMISRLYGLHIFVLPTIITVLIALHLAIIWRQYHTNYPGPGRSNQTIVGSRLWPTYTAKAIGLFFLVFGVLALLGGIVQINPIWIYGPYEPAATLPGAQPDWYMGWAEGALRLFPAVNLYIGGRFVPEVFFPAVLFPFFLFGGLYLYPFIERWITGDRQEHHVLRMPYQQPILTGLGSAGFMLLLVFLFAGSEDIIAVITHGSVVQIRTFFRVLAIAAPLATYVVVYGICRALRTRAASRHGQ
jgi:quinol---cytochrome-c reductase cytochrome b subunit